MKEKLQLATGTDLNDDHTASTDVQQRLEKTVGAVAMPARSAAVTVNDKSTTKKIVKEELQLATAADPNDDHTASISVQQRIDKSKGAAGAVNDNSTIATNSISDGGGEGGGGAPLVMAAEVAPTHDEEMAAAYDKGAQEASKEVNQLRDQIREMEQQREEVGVAIPIEASQDEGEESDEDGNTGGCSPVCKIIAAMVFIAVVVGVVIGTQQSTEDPTVGEVPSPAPTTLLAPTSSTNPPTIMEPQEFFVQQLGERLHGLPGDSFGSSVSLSKDGQTLAVGAVEAGSTGYVNLYRLSDDGAASWALVKNFTGDNVGDLFGHSVAVSGDGNTLAVGIPGPGSDILNAREGRVKVFDIGKDETWTPIGEELIGSDNYGGGKFGFSVSLSEDGKLLAVGEPEAGRANVYELKGGDWTRLGSAIEGFERVGWAVDLQVNERIRIAVSGRSVYDDPGQGQVFEFSDNDWVLMGQSLGQHELGDVSLSQDGTIVAFSGINRTIEFDSFAVPSSHSGFVSVYRFSNLTADWMEIGGTIVVENVDGAPSISLSSDGKLLAIGNPAFDSVGQVLLFYFENSTNTWSLVNDTLVNEQAFFGGRQQDGYFGSSIVLVGSRDNFSLAVGAPFASNVHGAAGTATVYRRQFGVVPKQTMEPTSAPTPANLAFEELFDWIGETNDVIGDSVRLSQDGKVVAFSYIKDAGAVVEIFESQSWGDTPQNWWGGESHSWRLIGKLVVKDASPETFAISGDGRVVAFGLQGNGENATVRVFQYRYDEEGRRRWNRYGDDIATAASITFDGINALTLSYSGSTIAIGTILTSCCYQSAVVYRMENEQWQQMGTASELGHVSSLSLSREGNRVAIATSSTEEFGDETGSATVFEYLDGQWQQLGQLFVGENRRVYFGMTISLSGDGNVVAINSLSNDMDNGRNVGHVRVYRYNELANDWTQVGKSLVAEAQDDGFGESFSLSQDGTKLVVGANRVGYVKVFEYDGESTYWRQVGASLEGESGRTIGFGSSVALADTDEGLRVAVGVPFFLNPDSGLTGKIVLFQEQVNVPVETPPVALSNEYPLQACEGNCQSDSDCDRGLFCFPRSPGESVPGCTGGTEDNSQSNYCYECQDVAGWLDGSSYPCAWYQQTDAPGCPNRGSRSVGLFGLTAKEACCYCKSTICGDVPNWRDSSGNGCDWYETFIDFGCPNGAGENTGLYSIQTSAHGGGSSYMSARDACCHCRTY